jgi:hypothetical protein
MNGEAEYTSLINEFKISNYKDIFTDDQEELFGSILFDFTQRYYKEKLPEGGSNKIIIPQITNKTNKSTITNFLSGIKTRIWDLYSSEGSMSITKDEEISYFVDNISTDILDSAITEVPIEIQLLQPETCDVANNLNSHLVSELQDLYNESLNLQTDEKIKIRNDLLKKLTAQNKFFKIYNKI